MPLDDRESVRRTPILALFIAALVTAGQVIGLVEFGRRALAWLAR